MTFALPLQGLNFEQVKARDNKAIKPGWDDSRLAMLLV